MKKGDAIIFGIIISASIYAYFFDFPWGETVWKWIWSIIIILWLGFTYMQVNNKTEMRKNPATGHWEEVTIKHSTLAQAEIDYQKMNELREEERLRQEQLNQSEVKKLQEKQKTERKKILSGNVLGSSPMNKVKRLKQLYINGTLTKAEFEKAKNKLLK